MRYLCLWTGFVRQVSVLTFLSSNTSCATTSLVCLKTPRGVWVQHQEIQIWHSSQLCLSSMSEVESLLKQHKSSAEQGTHAPPCMRIGSPGLIRHWHLKWNLLYCFKLSSSESIMHYSACIFTQATFSFFVTPQNCLFFAVHPISTPAARSTHEVAS